MHGSPIGLTVDDIARTWRYDGGGIAGSLTITLSETLAGSANSSRTSEVAVKFAVASATPPAPILLAIMAGQSNAEGGWGEKLTAAT